MPGPGPRGSFSPSSGSSPLAQLISLVPVTVLQFIALAHAGLDIQLEEHFVARVEIHLIVRQAGVGVLPPHEGPEPG